MSNVLPDLKFPIQPKPTWDIADSSKLKTFTTCPRMYFYEYVLGWRLDSPPIHTAFGSAIHAALEVLSLAPPDDGIENVRSVLEVMLQSGEELPEAAIKIINNKMFPTVSAAADRFYRTLNDELDPEWWNLEDYPHKNPGRAAIALLAYAERYKDDHEKYEHLHIDGVPAIELAGRVQIDRFNLAFRLDEILVRKSDGALIIRDHKTAGSFMGWDVQWDNDIQVGTYTHVLRCMDPEWGTTRMGMVLNGLLFNKRTKYDTKKDIKDPFRHVGFQRHESFRSNQQMGVWYWNALVKLRQIQQQFEWFSEFDSDNESVMRSFPMCETSCAFHFGRPCPYLNLCTTVPNPVSLARDTDCEPPIGYKTDHWNPLEKPANINLELEDDNE